MASSITYTPRLDGQFFTVDEINALFAQIDAALTNKLPLSGATLLRNIVFYGGGGFLNNKPAPAILDALPRGY